MSLSPLVPPFLDSLVLFVIHNLVRKSIALPSLLRTLRQNQQSLQYTENFACFLAKFAVWYFCRRFILSNGAVFMIFRDHYIRELRPFYDSDLIKIITGIRRCGKSVLMQQVSDEIRQKSDNIIYLEFERRTTRSELSSVDKILSHVERHRGKGKCYVFMDEVQEIPDWAEACQTLRLADCSVFITGSNSKLLSKEFTTALSGRYVSFMVRPFVFKELKEYASELGKEISVTDYLIWGGFPKRLEFDGDAMLRYLDDLDETIIYKDIIVRYRIRKEELFRTVANFVLRSNSRIVSAHSIFRPCPKRFFPLFHFFSRKKPIRARTRASKKAFLVYILALFLKNA